MLTKIKNLIKRSLITQVDTTTDIYKIQTTSYGTAGNSAMLMPYGLICNPVVGSEGLLFSIAGDSSRSYCLPFSSKLAPKASSGDTILFSNKTTYIKLDSSGNISINTDSDVDVTCNNLNATVTTEANVTAANITATATTQVDIVAPIINLTGNVVISGTLAQTGVLTAPAGVVTASATIGGTDFASHVHSGVTTGTSNTGPVV